jgi:hypothetical protein
LKKRYLVFLALMLIIFWSVAVVPGNAETVTKSFTLHDFDMTLAFPKTANPGDSVLVSVNAVAKSSVNVIDLSVQVLAYVEGGDLQSIGSASLATSQYQYVYKGNTLHKEFSVTIPTGILRGALVAVVSETTRSTGYSYYSYPYYYSYYGYYPYYYGSYNGYSSDHMYYYWYYPYYYTYYYPETYYNQYVESKTLPSTYVLATTPEYVQLKSDYDSLSADYQKLSSQYNDLSAKYQQAMDQNKDLSDRLSAATQNMNIATVLAIVFLVTTIILAVYAVHVSRKKKTVAPTTITPTVATPAAVAPPISEPEKVTATPEKKQVPKKTAES